MSKVWDGAPWVITVLIRDGVAEPFPTDFTVAPEVVGKTLLHIVNKSHPESDWRFETTAEPGEKLGDGPHQISLSGTAQGRIIATLVLATDD